MAGVQVPRNFKLIDDLEKAEKDPPPGISLGLDSYDDIYLQKWNATIMGPPGSPFEGRVMFLAIEATMRYPQEGPKVKFQSKVNIPGTVDASGRVDLNQIMQWKPERNNKLSLFDALVACRQAMEKCKMKQPADGTTY
eukprot:Hpha_TRINITY_DN14026_c0_g1::TRINITY_DN14026_c0_g1_i1::g.44471::m.44471/K10704/UBE2V; ubiquitin-conjugating enzyme E2 variant